LAVGTKPTGGERGSGGIRSQAVPGTARTLGARRKPEKKTGDTVAIPMKGRVRGPAGNLVKKKNTTREQKRVSNEPIAQSSSSSDQRAKKGLVRRRGAAD